MDEEQASLIRVSWSRVESRGYAVARSFYARLFELDPHIEDLFVLAQMDEQGTKFMMMLKELVRSVGDPGSFEASLAESGRRHRGYGVAHRHYRLVGEALLWALDAALPEGFDDETREAWAAAYTRMAFVMQRGSE